MKRILTLALTLAAGASVATQAYGFCGFFVAKADTDMFNKASKVVLVRDKDRTVLTMANDYKGDPKEFAMVIPVPSVLKKKQINVGDNEVIEHLDAFSAPRLVEYHDRNPCQPRMMKEMSPMADGARTRAASPGAGSGRKGYGVTVEASYEVGEYDIKILSAKESNGLQRWLNDNGYKTPKKARKVLKSYIKDGLKFFVAQVNLERNSESDYSYLRPLQVAYESERFGLPIRLGTVNAKGPQELFVYAITRKGRVETTNYKTKKIPTGMNVPVYVKEEFESFYTSLFDRQVKEDGMKAVYTEYAWNMANCDPCAADPLSRKELRKLGVYWIGKGSGGGGRRFRPRGTNAFVTRLHVRYDAAHFPEDLKFKVTADRKNFQGRYVIRHPFEGDAECKAMDRYKKRLHERRKKSAENLSDLTGWKLAKIQKKMKLDASESKDEGSWIDNLWQ